MRTSNHGRFGKVLLPAALALGLGLALHDDAHGEAGGDPASGVRGIYGNIATDQIEHLVTGERIKAMVSSGSRMAFWEKLEKGERVDCLDCIPAVEPLLYDANPRTREISAWWLRKRLFGVFGPGQVYARTLDVLASDTSPVRRARAAEALGEMLARPGVAACATALARDPDAQVRVASARALGRLGEDGDGALGRAMADADAGVRLAALGSASRINRLTDRAPVVATLTDADPKVRRRGAEVAATLDGRDAVPALVRVGR